MKKQLTILSCLAAIASVALAGNGGIASQLDAAKFATNPTVTAKAASTDSKGFQILPQASVTAPSQAPLRALQNGVIVPPYYENFNRTKALDGFTIINIAGDKRDWRLEQNRAAIPTYNLYDPETDNDDWLITPPIQVEAGKTYQIYCIAGGNGEENTEKISFYLGNQPTVEAMTTCLLPTQIIKTDWYHSVPLTMQFTAAESGQLYLGIYCNSPYSSWLWIDDLAIDAGYDQNSPAECQMTAQGVEDTKSATITVVAPTKFLNGSDLGTMTIHMLRDHSIAKTQENVAPGATVEFTDQVNGAGVHSYQAMAVYNGIKGKTTAEKRLYLGVEAPDLPVNITAKEDPEGTLIYNWEPSPNGASGCPMNTKKITYSICQFTDTPLYDELTEPTLTEVSPDAQPMIHSYLIKAKTAAGESQYALMPVIPVGKPMDFPVEISFPSAQTDIPVGWYNTRRQSSVGFYDDLSFTDTKSADNDNGFLGTFCFGGAYPIIIFPKVNVPAQGESVLSFFLNCFEGPESNAIKVKIYDEAGNATTILEGSIFTICKKNVGWNQIRCDLSQFAGKAVHMEIEVDPIHYAFTLFDDFKFSQETGTNYAITEFTAPEEANAYDPVTFKATVINMGLASTPEDGTFNIYNGDQIIASEPITGLLLGEKKFLTFTNSFTIHDAPEADIHAEIVCENDQDQSNNVTEEFPISIYLPDYPSVTLSGTVTDDDKASLTWSEPDMSWEPVTVEEGFEDYARFSQTFGSWTTYDLDGQLIANIANWPIVDVPCSFFVINKTDYSRNTIAHSGDMGLTTWYTQEGANNDWLITPKLSGRAQTISFWMACPQNYPEDVEVYYSTGSLDPNDFILIEKVEGISKEFAEFKYDLPDGAIYFAVRYFSNNQYGLMLDDFTFQTASETAFLTLAGYNLYRDGVKVNDEPIANCSYLDTDFSTSHKYSVTAAYDHKVHGRVESPMSNSVSLTPSAISTVAQEGVYEVARYGIDGRHLQPGTPGVSIIRYSDGSVRKSAR